MDTTRTLTSSPHHDHEKLLELSIQESIARSPQSEVKIMAHASTSVKIPDIGNSDFSCQDHNINPMKSRFRLFLDRFGYIDTLAFPLGFLAIVAALGILGSLWWWGNKSVDERFGLWYYPAHSGRLNAVVTTCSAIIRLALAAQALACCCMVASLILEKEYVRKVDAHIMSVYQWSNPGPSSLLYPLLGVWFDGRKSSWRPTRGLALAGLLAILNAFAQLSSTTLVSDMILSPLAQPSTPIPVRLPETMPMVTDSAGNSILIVNLNEDTSINPSELPIFAEEVMSNPVLETSGQVFGSSGSIRRAFLPLSSRQQATLHLYHGPAAVMESQYICLPPRILEPTVKTNFDERGAYRGLDIGGRFDIPFDVQEYIQGAFTHQGVTIPSMHDLQVRNCTFRSGFPSICLLSDSKSQQDSLYNVTAGILVAFAPDKVRFWDGSEVTKQTQFGFREPWHTEITSQHQEWTTIKALEGNHTAPSGLDKVLNLRTSMCVFYRKASNKMVKVTAFNGETTERQPVYFLESVYGSTMSTMGQANATIELAQKVLGVADTTWILPEKRGVLSLDVIEDVDHGQPVPSHNAIYFFGEHWKTWEDLNFISANLYESTLAKLNRASLALAALDFVHFAVAQQESLLRSTRVADPESYKTEYASIRPMLIPRRWIGFGIVSGIVTLHTFVVVYIILLYVRSKSFAKAWTLEEISSMWDHGNRI